MGSRIWEEEGPRCNGTPRPGAVRFEAENHMVLLLRATWRVESTPSIVDSSICWSGLVTGRPCQAWQTLGSSTSDEDKSAGGWNSRDCQAMPTTAPSGPKSSPSAKLLRPWADLERRCGSVLPAGISRASSRQIAAGGLRRQASTPAWRNLARELPPGRRHGKPRRRTPTIERQA